METRAGVGLMLRVLFACTALTACAPAHAHVGGLVAYLSENFGAQTPTGQGSVRLSAPGLGLLIKGQPVSWTLSDPTNSGYWKVNGVTLTSSPTTVSEGAAAMTPNLTSSGVSHAASLASSYDFDVSATFTDGSTSSATLHNVIAQNAMNVGDGAGRVTPPAGFGETAGAKILLSTGANRTSISFNLFNPANAVTVTQADPAHLGAFTYMKVYGSSNLTIDGLNPSPGYTSALISLSAQSGANSSNITVQNVSALWAKQPYNVDNIVLINLAGCDNCTVSKVQASNIGGLLEESQNAIDTALTFSGGVIRGYSNNAIFVANLRNSTISDVTVIAPNRTSNAHIDTFQISDGCAPTNLTVRRVESYQAEGDAYANGYPFGGTPSNWTGFIDDGSGNGSPAPAGHPGTVLTVTAIGHGSIYTGGTPIVAATGMSAGTRITGQLPGGASHGVGQYRVSISQTLAPTTIYTGNQNLAWNGILYTGRSPNTAVIPTSNNYSFTNYTDMRVVDPKNINATYFTGSTSGTTLTVNPGSIVTTWLPTGGGLDPANVMMVTGGSLSSDRIANNLFAFSFGSGGYGPGNYKLATAGSHDNPNPTSFSASMDAGFARVGPRFQPTNSTTSYLHTGSSVFRGGFMWSGLLGRAPASWTLTNSQSAASCVRLSACFAIGSYPAALNAPGTDGASIPITSAHWAAMVKAAAGDPEYFLEHIPAYTWALMTVAQVRAASAAALLPKSGGPLDAGGGNAYGALTFGGIWNDGSGLTP